MKPATDLATRISRALISCSTYSTPTRTWSSSLEQILHRFGCRDSLTPSLVARVIDPFLLTHHSLAVGFFNWASQQPGFTHSSFSYHSLFKSLSLSRQYNAVDALWKQVKAQNISLDPSVCRCVITCLILGKKTLSAFLIFNDVSSISLDIGSRTCNSLLAALASDGYIDSARKVYDEMIVRGVSFNTIGFGLFIWRFGAYAELGEVLAILDEVRKGDSEINGSIIAVLVVLGLCHASRFPEAFSALDELRSRDCKPDFMAYRIVAEAFRSTGSVFDTETVLKKKRKLGVAPRAYDYREFILALISERRVNEAKELGEVIVNGNFQIDDDVLNALVGSVSATDPDSAIEFFNFMIGKGRLPTLLTVSNLSRNLSKHGKTDELVEVFRVLSCNDYFSDTETYNVKVSFLCKVGRVREAYAVFPEMKKKGLSPDISSYNSLLEACCRQDLLRPAKRLWDEMFASGFGGNLKTYSILIKKISEVGQVEEAERLFGHMLEKGVTPDASVYTSLLEGLCQEAKFEAAFDIFNKSIKQDPMLARNILTTFMLYVCRKGHFLLASEFLSHLTNDIGHSASHVVLLKYLAYAGETQMALEHITRVVQSSPSMLQEIVTELILLLSSSSKSEPILQLLQAVQGQYPDVSNDTWKALYNR